MRIDALGNHGHLVAGFCERTRRQGFVSARALTRSALTRAVFGDQGGSAHGIAHEAELLGGRHSLERLLRLLRLLLRLMRLTRSVIFVAQLASKIVSKLVSKIEIDFVVLCPAQRFVYFSHRANLSIRVLFASQNLK